MAEAEQTHNAAPWLSSAYSDGAGRRSSTRFAAAAPGNVTVKTFLD